MTRCLKRINVEVNRTVLRSITEFVLHNLLDKVGNLRAVFGDASQLIGVEHIKISHVLHEPLLILPRQLGKYPMVVRVNQCTLKRIKVRKKKILRFSVKRLRKRGGIRNIFRTLCLGNNLGCRRSSLDMHFHLRLIVTSFLVTRQRSTIQHNRIVLLRLVLVLRNGEIGVEQRKVLLQVRGVRSLGDFQNLNIDFRVRRHELGKNVLLSCPQNNLPLSIPKPYQQPPPPVPRHTLSSTSVIFITKFTSNLK